MSELAPVPVDERTVSDALEEQLRLLRLFASMPGSGRYVLDVEVNP